MRNIVIKNLGLKSKTIGLPELIKDLKYFWLSMSAILLSICFPVAELQLLVLAIITGAKWITDGKNRGGVIIIERGCADD